MKLYPFIPGLETCRLAHPDRPCGLAIEDRDLLSEAREITDTASETFTLLYPYSPDPLTGKIIHSWKN